jgi:hypothetical protein
MDTFGNLEDWAKVLKALEDLKKNKKLGEHQGGLARILKYGQNWRLLEAVLQYGKDIADPSEEFLEAICDLMSNRSVYMDARILAVDALEYLVPRISREHGRHNEARRVSIIRTMKDILEASEPPKFHEAVARSLKIIEKGQEPEMLKQS